MEETKHTYLVSKKLKKSIFNYIKHSLILVPVIPYCVPTSAFAPLVGIPVGILRFVVGLEMQKRYNSTVSKN